MSQSTIQTIGEKQMLVIDPEQLCHLEEDIDSPIAMCGYRFVTDEPVHYSGMGVICEGCGYPMCPACITMWSLEDRLSS